MDERQNGGALRGRELLRLIRFGVMAKGYLEEKARGMVPEEHRECMEALEGLVGEALRVKTAVLAKATGEVLQLGTKALTRRRGRGVDWGRYCEGGGGRRLQALFVRWWNAMGGFSAGHWTGRFGYGGWIRCRRSACY